MHRLNIVQPSVKFRSRSVTGWQLAACVMADMCTKFHKHQGLCVPEMELNPQTIHCSGMHEKQDELTVKGVGRVCPGRCV